MAVWLKVTLLLIYLSVLFLLARLLEVVVWYEQGQISRRLLDPMALSVIKLKALLEQRGVSYDAILEKTDLKQLVEATGAVTDEGLQATSALAEEDSSLITNFTGDLDFYEQVEDAKDSMWLVEVVTDTGGLLSDTSWDLIRKKVGKFGVRFGRFDCHLNYRLCTRKQWYSSRLVLALPEHHRSKSNVGLHTYSGPVRINALFDWIKTKVNARIQAIEDEQSLQEDWLLFTSGLHAEVRVVFLSTLSSVPLFLSSLGVKFPGRVKIGHIDMKSEKGKLVAKKANFRTSPSYIVLTPENTYNYGLRSGETFTFRAMEMFLKCLYPSLNDMFIVSIACANIASCFELSIATGTILKRLIKFALCIFKYNFILLLVWIFMLGIMQIPLLENVCLFGLKLLRMMASTMLFSFIRKDIFYYSGHIVLPLLTLGAMLSVTWYIKVRFFNHGAENEEDESDWWNFSNLQTLDYEQWWELTQLRPFDQIFNPSMGILATAEQADSTQIFVSKEYIKHLPTWLYSDAKADKHDYADKVKDSCRQIPSCQSTATSKPVSEDIADSVMDSNYRCECSHICQCVQQRNPDSIGPFAVSGLNPGAVTSGTPPDESHRDVPICSHPPTCHREPHIKDNMGDQLPSSSVKRFGFIESSQCVICLEHYNMGVKLRGLPCGHMFHDVCILAWLTREHHFCPVCRWPSYKLKSEPIRNDLHSE